ncbi:hypothetical protein CEXT_297851 [Caerostris extrusa]|uniref:Uncharacterized protein n=1 Tax=Caerostris extrusa TaxID=172846 RepID=A0AAV4TUZ6_CAEEX|nr:hypothetical protein CEXT_297851 [Caerostris extrusa]
MTLSVLERLGSTVTYAATAQAGTTLNPVVAYDITPTLFELTYFRNGDLDSVYKRPSASEIVQLCGGAASVRLNSALEGRNTIFTQALISLMDLQGAWKVSGSTEYRRMCLVSHTPRS